jgi:predicted DNA-binding transcriptional regulator YafY
VRRKLEETFGQFELHEPAEPAALTEEEKLIRTIAEAIERRELVEIEYLKPDATETTTRRIEPYRIERALPYWYVHAFDLDRDAPRSFRVDRMRSARGLGTQFEPRPSLDLGSPRRLARVWISPEAARFWLERGATLLRDGAAIAELDFATESYLIGELLSARGEAVLLEPAELRPTVAKRARTLSRQLVTAPARSQG